MAGTFGTKQLLTALGLGAAIAGYQYYGLSRDAAEKEATAKIKTIPNGLKDMFASEEKMAADKLAREKALQEEKEEIVELDEHMAQAKAAEDLPSQAPPLEAEPALPSIVKTVAEVQPESKLEEKTDAKTDAKVEMKAVIPQIVEKPLDAKAQAVVTEQKRVELLAQLHEQSRCLPENGSFLNVRYKQFLMRINMADGFSQALPSLKGFVGRAKEAKVGELDPADCKSGKCYSLSEKLLSQITDDKAPVQKFECGTWLLVAEKVGDSCSKEMSFKTLSLTNDPGDKCIVGGLTDIQVSGGAARFVANAMETVTTYMTVQRKLAPLSKAAKVSEDSDENE